MSQGWSVIPLSRIQELKKERNLLWVCIAMLKGITEIWLEALSLDLDCCRRVNNVWYCSEIKPICSDNVSLSDIELSWFC